jgi:gamma-glutamyltranspeptidase/glutathione hydrolase
MSYSRRAFLASSLPSASLPLLADRRAEGRKVVVAAELEPAASAALAAVEAGGNAMDAAAAACLATCMLEPSAVDLGGYVTCAVVLEGKTGLVWAVDADSAAPAAASPSMYGMLPKNPAGKGPNENEYGCSVKGNANVDGALAVGVPSTLAGIGTLWERWGKLKWPQVVAPAQKLLEQGFAVSPQVAGAIQSKANVIRTMAPAAAHLMPGGRPLQAGQIWHRPDMEWTLKRIAAEGWPDFYRGEIGRRIADYVQSLGGILTRADLAGYKVQCTPAVAISIGKAKMFSAPLPNGGLTCASALLMLDRLAPPGVEEPLHWHLLAEVLKIAWRDRLRYFGDPAKADVEWRRFLSLRHVDEQVARLRKSPHSVDNLAGPPAGQSPGTIHISTADADGNLVAVTLTHGGDFGSCVTVPGTGITLGHGMSRFDPHPGLPNSVGPGKRPLNNVCPTILRQPGRDVAFGLRGGRRIVSVNLGLALQLLQGRSALDVVRAPRLHSEGYEPIQVTEGMPAAIRAELTKMGHQLTESRAIGGNANIAERDSGGQLRAASNVFAVGSDR